jgi:metal-responsive CopG/Arc/MetJ family transcriptional regulator
VRNEAYYLERGLRRVALALPVDLLVEFDQRVLEIPYRSRNSMLTEAVQHFLTCPAADWKSGDHPPGPGR